MFPKGISAVSLNEQNVVSFGIGALCQQGRVRIIARIVIRAIVILGSQLGPVRRFHTALVTVHPNERVVLACTAIEGYLCWTRKREGIDLISGQVSEDAGAARGASVPSYRITAGNVWGTVEPVGRGIGWGRRDGGSRGGSRS